MSNEKKNPLIGAFRAPPVGTPPSITQPTKQPDTQGCQSTCGFAYCPCLHQVGGEQETR